MQFPKLLLLGGLMAVGLGHVFALDAVTVNSPYSNCTASESIAVNYYIPDSSIVRYPTDDFFSTAYDALVSDIYSKVEIYSPYGVMADGCYDWRRVSNVVPNNGVEYLIFKTINGCTVAIPNQEKSNDPNRLDAQIHYKIGYKYIRSSGTLGGPWKLGYRKANQDYTCYFGGTEYNLSDCPEGTVKSVDVDYHVGECIDYRIFRCGDGIKQNGGSYDNGVVPTEECDPSDPEHVGWGNGGCSSTCEAIHNSDPTRCNDTNGDGIYDSCDAQGNGSLCSTLSDCVQPSQTRCNDTNGDGVYDSCDTQGDGSLCSSVSDCVVQSTDIDLEVEKSVSPGIASVGDEVTWTIKIDNHATVTATNVQLYDLLPSGVQYISHTASAGSYNPQTGIWTVGSIPEESQVVLTILTTITAFDASDIITNTACVGVDLDPHNGGEADQTDSNPGNNCDDAIVVPPAGGDADLFIIKTADKDVAHDDDVVTFTITFGNNGTTTAHNAVLYDDVPSGYDWSNVQYSWSQLDVEGTPHISTAENGDYYTITIDEFDIAPGQGGTLTLTAHAQTDGNACNYRTNRATLHSADDYVYANATVLCAGEPWIEKKQKSDLLATDEDIHVGDGDEIEYTLMFGNNGENIEDVYIEDELDDAVSFVEGTISFQYNQYDSSICSYHSAGHKVVCGPFSLNANGADGVLTYGVEVSDVNQCPVINDAQITYQGGSQMSNQVRAICDGSEGDNLDGSIDKHVVGSSQREVGDEVEFAITFTNDGDQDISSFTITDTWPEELGLLSDANDIRDSISPSSLDDPEDISFHTLSQGDKKITITWDDVLKPGEEVSFHLLGEILEDGSHENRACVEFENKDGDREGPVCDTDSVDAQKADATCGSLHGVDQDPILIYEDDLPLVEKFTCYPTDNQQSTIEIDCGNGDRVSRSDVYSLTATCTYDEAGTYQVLCYVNGEDNDPHCEDTFVLETKENVGPPDFGVCGDGFPSDYEHCDLGANNTPIGDSLFKNIYVSNPLGDGYVCKNCKIYKDDDHHPKVPEGSMIPECFYTDSTLSVQYNELFPFWWDVEYDKMLEASDCNDEDDYGILKESMKCTFSITNDELSTPLVVLDNIDCNGDMRGGNRMFDSFEELMDEGFQIEPGRYVADLNEVKDAIDAMGYGEYKLILSRVDYDYCLSGSQRSTSTDRCCQNNFTITKPYAMQKGTVTSKSDLGGTISTTIDPKNFYQMGRKDLFGDADWYQDYDLITAEDYDGGDAVDTLLNTFVAKYKALAVGIDTDGWKVVPNKKILYHQGDVTINQSDRTVPFTMIVEDGDLTIKGDIDVNAMFIVKDGRIIFDNDDCRESQVAKGIFITYGNGGFGHEEPIMYNRDVTHEWCDQGGLVIKGVMIGDDMEQLIDDKRSHLNNRFWTPLQDKFNLLVRGASLLIEQNPSLWLQSPPGLSELKSVLDVYRR